MESLYDLQRAVMSLDDVDFHGYQHFLFGCCNWLKSTVEWPVVKDAYEKCKLGLGNRSLFMKTPNWRDFRAFSTEERKKKAQYTIYVLLADLQEFQDWRLFSNSFSRLRGLCRFIPIAQIWAIWRDTVLLKPETRYTYPIEVRRMGWEIRKMDKYSELPVLGDLCEDMNLPEEAAHFHDSSFLHTYACRYLHNICKGMG